MSCRVHVRRPNLLNDYETEHHLVYVIRVSTRYKDQSGAWCIMDKCIVSQFRVGGLHNTKANQVSSALKQLSPRQCAWKNCERKLRRGGVRNGHPYRQQPLELKQLFVWQQTVPGHYSANT
jgi:hypothetical protein